MLLTFIYILNVSVSCYAAYQGNYDSANFGLNAATMIMILMVIKANKLKW